MQDFSMSGVYSPTKSLFSSVLLLLAPLSSVVTSAAGGASWRCPTGLPSTESMETYNGHCYQFVDSEKYWTSARDYCWKYGGKLVKVGDKETNHFIVTTLNNLPWRNKGVWIGLHDNTREMNFEWVTESAYVQEQLDWSHWGRGHPGAFLHSLRDCVRMVRGDGHWRWHETPCSVLRWRYKFICEYSMIPTTTTSTTVATLPLGGASWRRESSHPESGNARQLSITPRRLSTTTRRLSVTTWRLSSTTKMASKLLVMTSPNTRQTVHAIGPHAALAAHQRSFESGKGSTALIAGMLSCLVIIVLMSLLLFLLIRRRNKQQYVEAEEATDTSIVPIYVDDIDDIKKQMNITVNELSERAQNDYIDHPRMLPSVPLMAAARQSALYIEPDDVSDDENAANEKYENMSTKSPDYLPMDGQRAEDEAEKDAASKKVTYDVPKPMNIYSEIPERPETYENMYESLDEVKRKKNGGENEK